MSKVTEFVDLYKKTRSAAYILDNHKRIAQSPLPPKKQRLHINLLADAIKNHRNLASEVEAKMKKLSEAEQFEVNDMIGQV